MSTLDGPLVSMKLTEAHVGGCESYGPFLDLFGCLL